MDRDKDKVEWNGYPETKLFDAFRKEYLRRHDEEGSLGFHGTVKIHGANISIVYSNRDTWRIHSRNRVISKENDLYGCFSALSCVPLNRLVQQVAEIYREPWSELVIVGEWAGKGIHRGAAVCNLDKFFTIFNIRIDGKWHDIRRFRNVSLPEYRIFNICDFPTFSITLNLRDIDDVVRVEKEIESYIHAIEQTCPVAAHFGVNGPGEGLVFTYFPSSPSPSLLGFKAKCSAFETINRTALPSIPQETMAAIAAFVKYALTERRLDQGIECLEEMRKPIEPKSTGVYIGWVVRDVLKEESHILEEMGLSDKTKEVKSALTDAARDGWKFRLKEFQRGDLKT
jgi:hypothetical protein